METNHAHPGSAHPANHRLVLSRREQQQSVEVFYEGEKVGHYKADLIVEGRVIVEVKAIQTLSDVDIAQGLNDLRATGLPTCLLIHFGKAKIEVRRLGMGPGKGTGDMELEVRDIQ